MRLVLVTLVAFSLSCAKQRVPAPAPVAKSTADYLDIRPGIRLSVEKAYYAEGSKAKALDGFLGTQVAAFGLAPNGSLRLLSLDSKPFQGAAVPKLTADQLVPPHIRNERAYRFFYAVTFARSSRASASVLLAAKSIKQIGELSAQLKADPDRLCSVQSASCAVFPEGSTVSILMEITVNGAPKVVIWGSALGSATGGQPAARLERNISGHFEPVRLFGDTLRTALLPGDRVTY
jgi:hypothetical protein